MFDFEGDVPNDETWWKEKLVITSPTPDDTEGKVTFNLVLDDSNTIDEPTDSNGIKINETGVVIKGFQVQSSAPTTGKPTTINTEVSTVTLGLNGSLIELKNEVNADWIFNKKEILFKQGFEPITADGISSIIHEAITGQNGWFTLKFKVAANKYFGADGNLAKSEQEFSITVKGISANNTATTELKNKSGNPLSIALVDPALAEKTFDEYLADSANIFTKEFVFKYRKHLLTGDFSKIDSGTADNFLKDYGNPANSFVKVIPNNTGKTIEIKFIILKEKLVGQQTPADKEYSITFNGFS